MSQLNFNVAGDPGDDQPTLVTDHPPGGTTLSTHFEGVEGRPPNRFVALVPPGLFGGAWLTYQQGRKRFRVIVPPGEGQWEANLPPCIPPEYGDDKERVALFYGPTQTPAEDIRPAGRYLRTVSGRHVPWRGITGFQVIERVATRISEAEAFLDFCAEHRAFPRALAMAQHLFKLAPEQGLEALPTYLAMVKARGLYTEVISLADTGSYAAMDFDAYVAGVGHACATAGCAIDELGNELLPIHSTQSDRLTPDRLMHLARLVPATVPVSLGSTHGHEAESRAFAELAKQLPNGYATAHDIRTDEENWWKWVRHPNDLGWIADDARIFLSSNEAQKIDMTPGKHLGTAAVCRVIRAIGDTFHYNEGRYARVPTGGDLTAFLGRVSGWNLVPDEWLGQYRNAGQGWPVRGFSGGLRCYSSISHANANEAFTLALDSNAMQIEWYDDARPELVVARDGTRVFRVTR